MHQFTVSLRSGTRLWELDGIWTECSYLKACVCVYVYSKSKDFWIGHNEMVLGLPLYFMYIIPNNLNFFFVFTFCTSDPLDRIVSELDICDY